MKKIWVATLVSGALLSLTACSSFDRHGPKDAALAPIVNGKTVTKGVSSGGVINGQRIAGSRFDSNSNGQAPAGLPNVIRFGFDRYTLDGQAQQLANQNADYLLQHPKTHVMITGNTDPRGSQEYNFHLGQRRADAVKHYLLSQGVPAAQMCTVSYGELKPAVTPAQVGGDWKKAYALDRRSVIVYGQTCKGQAHNA